MRFTVLSHAGLLVECGGLQLVCDPWLIGSAYWRSWWNYPPVKQSLLETLRPDYVYLTHIHWDHFHGLSLRKFPRTTPIVIPRERYGRMRRDLKVLGFKNVVELRHGETKKLGPDFSLTSYQFSPFADSAVVIAADGVKLLNANDAKIIGLPLDKLLQQHPAIDFVLRSHSSANDRVCFEYLDNGERYIEDPTIYARSFSNFVKRVRPRYAIPFASNHCHLHRDVYRFNERIQTPFDVKRYFDAFKERSGLDTELVVMVSGDSWDSGQGFSIQANDYFEDRSEHLARYAKSVQPALEKFYAREAAATLTLQQVEKFFKPRFREIPFFLRRKFRGKRIVMVALSGETRAAFEISIWDRTVREIDPNDLQPYSMIYEASALILKQALALNMFSHVGISKRVTYRATREDMHLLQQFVDILNYFEYELLPLRKLVTLRTAVCFSRRWRELVLYSQLMAERLRGRQLIEVEQKYLASHPEV
jgi:UDP-MurNAc hydroxylase